LLVGIGVVTEPLKMLALYVLPSLLAGAGAVEYSRVTTKFSCASAASCQKTTLPTGNPSRDLYMVAVAVRLIENPSKRVTAVRKNENGRGEFIVIT
jgi:hypothetical protein